MPSALPPKIGGLVSAFLPGLGHFLRGYSKNGVITVLAAIFLGTALWGIHHLWGTGPTIFLAILIIPPWWCLQAFQASRPSQEDLHQTLAHVYAHSHDIQYLGGLFLVTALLDGAIILANPAYSLTLFCTKPADWAGLLAKLQSPFFHILIGFGFLQLRRWAFFTYLVYAAFGILNATVNFGCFGYGHIRTVFFLSLIGFTAYILWRRDCFSTGTRQGIHMRGQ